jgi:mRNA interferase HigB
VGEYYRVPMRVIAKSRLRRFWESSPKYRDAKKQMTEWYNFCASAKWNTPHKLKADLGNASILKINRVVFNVCGNKYRIVVLVDYTRHGMLIWFVGAHEEYDQIEDIENI